jgi:hypothetical protein
MIDQRINYVHDNPVRSLIVGSPEDYLFSSARIKDWRSQIMHLWMV